MTGMGKTWLMKRIVAVLRQHKQKVLVYSGTGDIQWPAGCKVTCRVEELEQWLGDKANFKSHVFLDEARVLYSKMKPSKHPNIDNLFTMGRHKGFTVYVATQYPTSIPPAVRVNCPELYCFRLGAVNHAKIVQEDYGDITYNGEKIAKQILHLKKLDFFRIIQPDTVSLVTLDKVAQKRLTAPNKRLSAPN
tara:strand:+ start:7769 stop:8341 length:573 start_codon:yes stop_codon:yes gene_type:complete